MAVKSIKWNYLCIILMVNFVHSTHGQSTYSFKEEYSAPGIEYSEDMVLGGNPMFSNGNQWARDLDDYHITLMAVEGNIANYIAGISGYLMGFQWYNDMYATQTTRIKIQLYRLSIGRGYENIEGDYMLMHQTGWINATKGLNYYLFDEAIAIDSYVSGSQNYFMAFMIDRHSSTPVLHDYCRDTGEVLTVLTTTRSSMTEIGDVVRFPSTGPTGSQSSCESYSFQGIFLPTNYASYTQGSCIMRTAKYHNSSYITNPQPFPEDGSPICYIVRAEKPEYGLEITTIYFDLQHTQDCYSEHIQVGDEALLSDYEDFNLWGTYCGDEEDIFGSKHIQNPYLYITASLSSSQANSGFKFKIEAKDHPFGYVALAIGLGVFFLGLALIIGIIVCCVCCCGCCCCLKKKGNVRNTNSRSTTQTNTTQVTTSQTQAVGNTTQQAPKPYPVQQMPVSTGPIQPQQPYPGMNYGAPVPPIQGQGQGVHYPPQQAPPQMYGNQPLPPLQHGQAPPGAQAEQPPLYYDLYPSQPGNNYVAPVYPEAPGEKDKL